MKPLRLIMAGAIFGIAALAACVSVPASVGDVRILSHAELAATFGDAPCTACVFSSTCSSGFLNGDGDCSRCGQNSSTAYLVCCQPSDNMGENTTCSFTTTAPCSLLHYWTATSQSKSSCGQCTGMTWTDTMDFCTSLYNATGGACGMCSGS
jgi:hypothetical protein